MAQEQFPTQDPVELANLYASEAFQEQQAEKRAQEARLTEWFGTANEATRPTDPTDFEFKNAAESPKTAKELQTFFNARPESAEDKGEPELVLEYVKHEKTKKTLQDRRESALGILDNSNISETDYEKVTKNLADKNSPAALSILLADAELSGDKRMQSAVKDAVVEKIRQQLEKDGEPETAENYTKYLEHFEAGKKALLKRQAKLEQEKAEAAEEEGAVEDARKAVDDVHDEAAKSTEADTSDKSTPDEEKASDVTTAPPETAIQPSSSEGSLTVGDGSDETQDSPADALDGAETRNSSDLPPVWRRVQMIGGPKRGSARPRRENLESEQIAVWRREQMIGGPKRESTGTRRERFQKLRKAGAVAVGTMFGLRKKSDRKNPIGPRLSDGSFYSRDQDLRPRGPRFSDDTFSSEEQEDKAPYIYEGPLYRDDSFYSKNQKEGPIFEDGIYVAEDHARVQDELARRQQEEDEEDRK